MTRIRISRPCYDKPHRCPGWAGGGWTMARMHHTCESGSIRTRTPDPEYAGEFMYPATDKWRFGRCVGSKHNSTEGCGVITMPWALRKLDPSWWTIYGYQIRNWLSDRRNR